MMTVTKTASVDAIGCELAAEVLGSYGFLRLGVTGWSMVPAIWPGDVLLIERTHVSEVSEGEIVLFRRGRRLVAHRVVKAADSALGSGLQTLGDAMKTPDAPISQAELLGRVTSIVRNGKPINVPRRSRPLNRAISTVMRNSEIATRVAVGVQRVRLAMRVQTA